MKHFFKISSNSEALASELLENLEEMFLQNCMNSVIYDMYIKYCKVARIYWRVFDYQTEILTKSVACNCQLNW